MRRRFALLVFISLCLCANASDFLFKKGKSNYKIVLSENASQSETTAARELQNYIRLVGNAELPIVNSGKAEKPYIFIGHNKEISKDKPLSSDESFTYCTADGNLYIWGGEDRGTMYGVFTFLENELGIRWYTPDYTKIPKLNEYRLPELNHSENPCFQQRLNFYQGALADAKWCAHNRLNEQYTPHRNEYGNTTACCGIHTVFKLVPPEKYFDSHPEYFSLRNGKRQHQKGQLCLSNPNVIRIATQSIIETIRNKPDYWTYDVSQADNQNYCQCRKCSSIAKRYGGQSGLMIWFVNQVADGVAKIYPDKKISTFAYQYTRHAPKKIKPRGNVVIRMCDIECCFHHSLESGTCQKNIEFMNDLKEWKKISNSIYIWDYVVNFYNYLVPFPNFHVLKDNIQTFSKNNVIGILEEGAHNANWAEFSELRQWIIAQLLWNPGKDTNLLVKEFINDYYGSAAPQIQEYFNMAQNISEASHIVYNTHYEHSYYDDKFISKARPILEKAYTIAKNDNVIRKRVNRVLAQVYYLYTCRHREEAKKDNTYQKLKTILDEDPTSISEGKTDLDKHINRQGFT